MKLSLTIVTPTLNSGGTLAATLLSLQPLARAGAKVIVVDSHSTDDTLSIASSFGAEVLEVAAGNMYEAINKGIWKSSATWYTYINSDDILYADSVQKALDKFKNTADLIYGSIDYIDWSGRLLHSWNSPPPEDFIDLASKRIMAIPQAGTLFRAEVVQKLSGFDARFRYASDFDFFLRAHIAGFRFARFEFPRIAAFRLHAKQISQSRTTDMENEADLSIRKNSIHGRKFKQELSYIKFKARNWDSYLLRMLRARHITGKSSLRTTLAFESSGMTEDQSENDLHE